MPSRILQTEIIRPSHEALIDLIKDRLQGLSDDEKAEAVLKYKDLHPGTGDNPRGDKGEYFFKKWAEKSRGEGDFTKRQQALKDLRDDMELLGIDSWIGWSNEHSFYAHLLLNRLIGRLGSISHGSQDADPRDKIRDALSVFADEVKHCLFCRLTTDETIEPGSEAVAGGESNDPESSASITHDFIDSALAEVAYVWNNDAKRSELLYYKNLHYPAVVDGLRGITSGPGRIARPQSESHGLVSELELDVLDGTDPSPAAGSSVFYQREWPYNRNRMAFSVRESIDRSFVFSASWLCRNRRVNDAQLFMSFRLGGEYDRVLDELKKGSRTGGEISRGLAPVRIA